RPAEAVATVHHTGGTGCTQQRRDASWGYGQISPPKEFADSQRVRSGDVHACVACHRSDAYDRQLGTPDSKHDREGIIDSRIAVKDDLMCHRSARSSNWSYLARHPDSPGDRTACVAPAERPLEFVLDCLAGGGVKV